MGLIANLLFGSRAESKEQPDIAALIQDGALLIDVRSVGEFAGGHIDGAINIPHTRITQEIAKYETDKNRNIIVYCHSGARASVARNSLIKMGYSKVVNGGGLRSMRKQIEKKEAKTATPNTTAQ